MSEAAAFPEVALRRLFAVVNGATPDSQNQEFWNGEVTWVTPEDLSNRSSPDISGSKRTLTRSGYESCGTSLVPAGSIVLSTRAPIGNLGVATTPLCTNQGCKSLVPRSAETNSRFFFYQLSVLSRELNRLGKGTTFLELSASELAAFKVSVPSPNRQERIANFLDEQTARIDALIAEKETLTEALGELRLSKLEAEMSVALAAGTQQLRRALISMSQGWSPVAESFSASPENWGVLKLSAVKNGAFVPTENKQVSEGTEVPEGLRVRSGDVLLTRANTPDLVGSAALVTDDSLRLFPSDLIYTVRVDPVKLNAAFLVYFLQSPQARAAIEVDARGSSQSMVKLSQEHIKSWRVPQLPLSRQEEVVERLQSEFAALADLKAHVLEHIARLREYRSSLISAAVTGQLDLGAFKERRNAA